MRKKLLITGGVLFIVSAALLITGLVLAKQRDVGPAKSETDCISAKATKGQPCGVWAAGECWKGTVDKAGQCNPQKDWLVVPLVAIGCILFVVFLTIMIMGLVQASPRKK